MKYLILIYGDESAMANATADDMKAMMEAHNAFGAGVPALGGQIVGGEALEASSTATTIRDDVVTDGPFLESKEALGGFYVIEAKDLDQAIAIAKTCPAPRGGVEVRPIWDTSTL
jgi:hypothetical protein